MMLRRGTRVVDLGDGAVRVGVRPGTVLHHLSVDERRFVERLESGAHVSRQHRERYRAIIDTLVACEVLYDPAEARRPTTVALTDAGAMGLACGTALAHAGAVVAFSDSRHAATAPTGTYSTSAPARTREGAAAATLRSSMPLARVQIGPADARFWVLVSHGAPDLAAAVTLLAHDIPHLFVVTDERGALVGPLVIPGRGACGWCEGLARTAADPTWPRQALQLTAPGSPPAQAGPDVTAGIASLVTGAWLALERGDADAWLGTQWVLTESAPPASRALAADPGCGCGAAHALGDEVAAHRARFPGAPVTA